MRASLDLAHIGAQFEITGTFVDAYPFGNGHINATYLATYREKAREYRYLHQRINERVFTNIPHLMHNIGVVTRHMRAKLETSLLDEARRRVLTLVRCNVATKDGADAYCDDYGYWWRTYEFIEGATAYDFIDTPEQALAVGRAFGGFLQAVDDLDPSVVFETLPNFHDTRKRFDALQIAIAEDSCQRAIKASDEIAYCLQREDLADRLDLLRTTGSARVRVTHNDTKVNNVLLDDRTGEGICVIDLDTVMPGLALYDFGDIVRTATTSVAEDEIDLSKVRVDARMFEAVTRGYVEAAGAALSSEEIEHLLISAHVITFENGIRFLADYLMGDTYFRIRDHDQNLRRARVQFALMKSLEEQRRSLDEIVLRVRV